MRIFKLSGLPGDNFDFPKISLSRDVFFPNEGGPYVNEGRFDRATNTFVDDQGLIIDEPAFEVMDIPSSSRNIYKEEVIVEESVPGLTTDLPVEILPKFNPSSFISSPSKVKSIDTSQVDDTQFDTLVDQVIEIPLVDNQVESSLVNQGPVNLSIEEPVLTTQVNAEPGLVEQDQKEASSTQAGIGKTLLLFGAALLAGKIILSKGNPKPKKKTKKKTDKALGNTRNDASQKEYSKPTTARNRNKIVTGSI